MGLFELLFERKNPGRVGRIEENNKKPKPVGLFTLLIKLSLSSAIIYLLLFIFVLHNFSAVRLAYFVFFMLLYCFIAYKFIPRPDKSNVGWFGGLVDNPFRYTDDINRFLIFLMILLYPGRFIATTFVQFIMFLRGKR